MSTIVQKPTPEQLQELKVSQWAIWECAPSTFDWYYNERETCYFLEGKVTIKADNQEISIGKGDLVIFPKGLSCTWVIQEQVRKHYQFG